MFERYHSPGPLGSYALGHVMAGFALTMWVGVMGYFLVFFKRDERRKAKLREQMRLQPPAAKKVGPRKVGPKRPETGKAA